MSIDLFSDLLISDPIKPVRPRALKREEWPPDYSGVLVWRIRQLEKMRSDPSLVVGAKAYYSTHPSDFIMHWMDTFDPRRVDTKWIPFIFFERQLDLVDFLHECFTDGQSGLIEKCRDAGATWVSCAYSVWRWLFVENDALGWGSRKESLVDKLGDADSIFEKMRLLINRLPAVFRPAGFNPRNHTTYMKLINPENGAIIAGEAGDNIGRGGRKSGYFKDESAWYERPEKIEAALGDNTNVQIDISSVNGLGNVFHRRREQGVDWFRGADLPRGETRVFVIDWSDHPAKTQEWYDERREKFEREAMLHIFAQEVERNYSASVSNTIILKDWILASVDAHLKIPCLIEQGIIDRWGAGFDVADEGIDRNAFALRQGNIIRHVEEWGERDAGVSTRRAVAACRGRTPLKVQYDSVGLGSAVKAEYNRLVEDGLVNPSEIKFVPWNAGAKVMWPFERVIEDDDQSPTNKAMFFNLKAQAWWSLRSRFYKTYRAVKDGIVYRPDELISIDSRMELLHQLTKELSQATKGDSSTLQMLVNKKPNGTKSPNLADAIVQCMFPVDDSAGQMVVGRY
jgi:hypothetical protein